MLKAYKPKVQGEKGEKKANSKKYPVSCTFAKYPEFCKLFGISEGAQISGRESVGYSLAISAYAFSLLPDAEQEKLLQNVSPEIAEFFQDMNA